VGAGVASAFSNDLTRCSNKAFACASAFIFALWRETMAVSSSEIVIKKPNNSENTALEINSNPSKSAKKRRICGRTASTSMTPAKNSQNNV